MELATPPLARTLTSKAPPVTVVMPVYVFTPVRICVPVPLLVKASVPASKVSFSSTPENVPEPLPAPTVRVRVETAPRTRPFPVRH